MTRAGFQSLASAGDQEQSTDTTSGASAGTGYAGGADDSTRVRAAEALKKVLSDVRDKAVAVAMRELTAALPRDWYGTLGWEVTDAVRGGKLLPRHAVRRFSTAACGQRADQRRRDNLPVFQSQSPEILHS